MPGPAPTVIRALAEHPFFKRNIRFNTLRGQDKNAAAKILLLEHSQRLWGTKKSELDRFVLEAEETTVVSPSVHSHLFSEQITEDFEAAYGRGKRVLDIMSELFAVSDPILSSAGALSLYYWLIRNHEAEYGRFLRGFLITFEKLRLNNRKALNSGEDNIDDELVKYDIYNRSPDDVGSLEVRYSILSSRLKNYVQGLRQVPRSMFHLSMERLSLI